MATPSNHPPYPAAASCCFLLLPAASCCCCHCHCHCHRHRYHYLCWLLTDIMHGMPSYLLLATYDCRPSCSSWLAHALVIWLASMAAPWLAFMPGIGSALPRAYGGLCDGANSLELRQVCALLIGDLMCGRCPR